MLQSLPIDCADAHVWEFYAFAAWCYASDCDWQEINAACADSYLDDPEGDKLARAVR